MPLKPINPVSLGTPRGYSNGIATDGSGRLLFIAGQVAWDPEQHVVSDDFAEQFDRALANVITVVEAAGGQAEQIARLTIYVTSRSDYLAHTKEIGVLYRNRMGTHFPAMVLVEVKGLLDVRAKVEIEGMAVI